MSTDILTQIPYALFRPWQWIKGDPQDSKLIPYHPELKNTTHTVLNVQEPVSDSPTSGPVHVNILNGSNGTSVCFRMNSTDTIGKLKQKTSDFGGNSDLAYNGKPVKAHQTLAELQVKDGATFVTYQKCHGG